MYLLPPESSYETYTATASKCLWLAEGENGDYRRRPEAISSCRVLEMLLDHRYHESPARPSDKASLQITDLAASDIVKSST